LVCPHCSRDARFVERRGKWCASLLGSIRLTRCYYHCRGCGKGHVPWDQALGLGVATLTPAASEVCSIAGVQTSFAQAAEVTLQKLCGLRLSESTVERVTEAAGERLSKLLQNKTTFGEDKSWRWQRDARGRTCAYVGLGEKRGAREKGDITDYRGPDKSVMSPFFSHSVMSPFSHSNASATSSAMKSNSDSARGP